MRSPVKAKAGDAPAARDVGSITQTDIVRFAGAGGDFNPLHHDREFAESAGFSKVISMGQMQAGMLAAWLSDWFGVEHIREYEVRFVAPLFLGDTVRLSGEVVAVHTEEDICTAEVALVASREDEPVVKASATAVVTPA